MATLSTLAGILGLSVVSGINLYLAVLTVGLAERYHWVSGLPPELQVLAHPAVLIAAALLFLIEFFADKVPFVTVVWDGIHTFVRPVGGALLALGAAGNLHPTVQVIALLAGGTIALGAHGSKMGFRLLAHTAPEPTTHSLISIAEDVGVVGLLALAYSHPYVALPVLAAIILFTALMLPLLFRVLHFLLAGFAGRVMSWVRGAGRHEVAEWAELAILELDHQGSQRVVRAFARRAKGAPRLKDGFLAHLGGRWHFIHRGLFRTKAIAMDEGSIDPLRVSRGLIWDSLVFLRDGKAQVFFLPKDWARTFHGEAGNPPRNLKEVY
ncbi:MAG: DUF4126 domain-containing protein [Holophagaceae bacterium]|nr:DUF4126 domain-containing protein [Holophagaceae bacterium]